MILLVIPAALLTAVSVAAFFGRWWWLLDFLANFRLQYALMLGLMALLLFLARWPRWGSVALVGAAVNAAVMLPLFLGEGRTIPPQQPIRVMSFNLLSTNQQFGEVIAYIRELDADIVFLHEASRPWEMALEGAGLPYEMSLSRSQDLNYGTVVLTRSGGSVTSYGFTTRGARAVQVVHDGVAVLGIHPLAPTTAQGSALRNAQVSFAADWSRNQDGPHAVTGDFNATPWSYPFRELLAETELENSQRGFGLQTTFPAGNIFLLRVPIDHLVHSPDLVVADRRLGPPLGSDHFPLVVDLWRP
ncbi:MAG: endonuclease/exonuclease/phosphatase family protein [Actinomycetota bacterium]